jgi:hypothetical protein
MNENKSLFRKDTLRVVLIDTDADKKSESSVEID